MTDKLSNKSSKTLSSEDMITREQVRDLKIFWKQGPTLEVTERMEEILDTLDALWKVAETVKEIQNDFPPIANKSFTRILVKWDLYKRLIASLCALEDKK